MSMLANRLRKNVARLSPWAKREGITAWRAYDRDVPEFPYAIDRYAERALVTEYVTPVGRRQEAVARDRERADVLHAVSETLGLSSEAIVFKARERHLSVERQAQGDSSHELPVEEHGRHFLVNLVDYLDTGLFLDHRVARRRVGELARGRRMLNLFSYTGAFSVYAATGGAAATTSVDLSASYLAWTKRNFELNDVDARHHQLVRADVEEFLRGSRETWDLIVLDPPTVSRSKGGRSFDIQAAHPLLIDLALAHLARDGVLLFSTNFRQFRLDAEKLPRAAVTEMTRATTPPDFREPGHRAFEIRWR